MIDKRKRLNSQRFKFPYQWVYKKIRYNTRIELYFIVTIV